MLGLQQLHMPSQVRREDQRLRQGLLHDFQQLIWVQTEVVRRQDRPQLGARPQRIDVFDAVLRQHTDPRASSDPARRQIRRQPRRALMELPIRKAPLVPLFHIHDGDAVAVVQRTARRVVGQGRRCRKRQRAQRSVHRRRGRCSHRENST
jgi:hypothetical protein